ncbi:extracellular globin-E1 isoform X2 [Condylostylus longicornis]|uniref:extracellular globin-E1 isoform X2 n=1 Tax=Condylostylus longicornis TaxID=2530218 RepID=UPI00244DF9E4|nr:extracellular globin-E1 isoform X2 [Condylostylus longicornis]
MDMSDCEMGVVMASWKVLMENPEETGKAVLGKFFEEHPQYVEYFNAFRGKTLAEIKQEPKFAFHAGKIVYAFDNAIKAAEERGRDAILGKASWDKLAKDHLERKIPKQAFKDLQTVMLNVIADVCNLNQFQRNAWEKLLKYLFGIITSILN